MVSKAPGRLERSLVGFMVRRLMWGNRRGKSWPVPDSLPHDTVSFPGNSGAVLSGRYFHRPGAVGVVVLCHPDRRYGQHWFVQEGWIEFLTRAGFDVLTFDFAPFGGSRGGSTYLHEDVLGAIDFARRWSGNLPVHVVGLSIGAFAAINASPHTTVESLVLESPYPSFNAWYGSGPLRWMMAAFDRAFPRTAAMIQADHNIAQAQAKRILIAATRSDEVTGFHLSQAVARQAPAERTQVLTLDGIPHLSLFRQSARYRESILEALQAPRVEVPIAA
jgi:alpha-beta hydrolase superfamily lysophospholipase